VLHNVNSTLRGDRKGAVLAEKAPVVFTSGAFSF
jgi:hypothetical protein